MFTTKVRSKKASSCHDARSSAAPDVRSCSTAAPRIRAVVGSERGRHESGRTHAERRITNRALSARDAAIQFALSWRGMSRSLRTVPKRAVRRFARYLPPLRLLLPTKCSFANTCTPGAASLERAGVHIPVALCFPPVPETPLAAVPPPPTPAGPSPAQTAPATGPSPRAHSSECRSERACALLALAGPQGSTMGALVSKLLNTLLGNKEVRTTCTRPPTTPEARPPAAWALLAPTTLLIGLRGAPSPRGCHTCGAEEAAPPRYTGPDSPIPSPLDPPGARPHPRS